tara:strand:- start:482 stop:604 length:123 start_codon:yes stop_codon:yes gene_type:complete
MNGIDCIEQKTLLKQGEVPLEFKHIPSHFYYAKTTLFRQY